MGIVLHQYYVRIRLSLSKLSQHECAVSACAPRCHKLNVWLHNLQKLVLTEGNAMKTPCTDVSILSDRVDVASSVNRSRYGVDCSCHLI